MLIKTNNGDPKIILKIINNIINLIKTIIFSENKVGSPAFDFQIDKKMLNYEPKNYRGRSSINRTDAFFIVEISSKIALKFVSVILYKKESILVPIINTV